VSAPPSKKVLNIPPPAGYQERINQLRLRLADMIEQVGLLSEDDVEPFRALIRKLKSEFWLSVSH